MNDQLWHWVDAHSGADPNVLRLKYHKSGIDGFDINDAITQIECRRRFGKKLAATLEQCPHFFFPKSISGEQCTGDRLAAFHASLPTSGSRIVDLTAGLGIDALYMAQNASSVTAVEIDTQIADALEYNSRQMGLRIAVVNADCRDFIACCRDEFDVAFIDPARRDSAGRRLYALTDCNPDVTAMLPAIKRIARRLIVKASPMLDIKRTITELPGTSRIISIGTTTECKELIAIVDFDNITETSIEATTIMADGTIATTAFTTEAEAGATAEYATPAPGDYIYEPWPAVMKAAPMKLLAQKYNLRKVAPNTHIYFSDKMEPAFPGTVMRLDEIIPYKSKHIKRLGRLIPRAEIATRNFPVHADTLRKKLKISDGGSTRILALTDSNGSPEMLILSETGTTEKSDRNR